MSRHAFTLALAFALLTPAPAAAGTLHFPEAGPGFDINEPAGWTHGIEPEGSILHLAAPAGGAWVIFVVMPDLGRTIDEAAGTFAQMIGAEPPKAGVVKLISGHFGKEYDVDTVHPTRGGEHFRITIMTIADRRLLYAATQTRAPMPPVPRRRGQSTTA
jgi:hypothetical protein